MTDPRYSRSIDDVVTVYVPDDRQARAQVTIAGFQVGGPGGSGSVQTFAHVYLDAGGLRTFAKYLTNAANVLDEHARAEDREAHR